MQQLLQAQSLQLSQQIGRALLMTLLHEQSASLLLARHVAACLQQRTQAAAKS
jgi:hypothetical protein